MNREKMHLDHFMDDVIMIVINIRNELSEKYDVSSKEYNNFKGLCNIACEICRNRIEEMASKYNADIIVGTLHGEQAHHPRLFSELWVLEHTWLYVTFNNYIIYVDPTSSQFKDLYKDIPDFYISIEPPKWYYPDKNNPRWGFLNKLNDMIVIPRKIIIGNKQFTIHDGIIEILQYEIWGRISNTIRKILLFINR